MTAMTENPDDEILLDDDEILLTDDAAAVGRCAPGPEPWVVLVADDEPDVHAMTALILGDAVFDGRRLSLLSAFSAAEAREALSRNRDVAVALLDVVMDGEHAGLDLVRWIREDLGDREIRIILRTGQPGSAPPREVAVAYDINDYKPKAETSAEALFAAVISALRAYKHIRAVERRAAAGAAELAHDRERLRALLESSPVGVCAFDGEGRATFANAQLNAMLGLPGDRLNGVRLEEMLADAECDSWALRWVRERRQVRDAEICLRRADDSTFWALLNADMATLDGRTVYLAWIFDIDRRKSAERRLAEARDIAEAATAAKSSFLATMAHEIRTPMNGVLGMLELLERTRLDPRQSDIVATVRDSAAALLAIVNDVLDYSKIEAGRMELERAPASLGQVVEGVCEMLGPAARAKGLRLTCYVDPGLPAAVLADQIRLRQILFNLAGNAVKFTQEGRVQVRAYPQARSETWVRVAFEVADSGIGISPDALSRLFAPFTQAEPSIARRFGGSGLGLSITRRLVELMRGEITVDSAPGRGSVFCVAVTFDVAASPALDAFGRPEPSAPNLGGLRVLAASAVGDELAGLADYLAAAGAVPVLAEGPAQVTTACRDAAAAGRGFDVIVLAEEIYAASVAAAPELLGRRAGEPAPPVALLAEPGSELGLRVASGRVPGMAAVVRPVRRVALLRSIDSLARGAPLEPRCAPAPAPAADATGRPRVLVADDNAVNRKVAAHQLSLLGYDSDCAADGLEALEMFRRGGYRAVLTDLQMPGMDGAGLARAVRAEEGAVEPGARTLVVAYTAAASDPAAGLDGEAFDGRLDKPLSLDRLAVFFPYVGAGPAPNDAAWAGKRDDGTETAAAAVDLPALVRLCGGDASMAREMLREFMLSADVAMDELRAAAADEDRKTMRAAAHNLRGASRTAGAKPLAEAALALERAARDPADGGGAFPLRAELAAVESALAAVSAFVAAL